MITDNNTPTEQHSSTQIAALRKHLITVRGTYLNPLLNKHAMKVPLHSDVIQQSYERACETLRKISLDEKEWAELLESDLKELHETLVGQYVTAAKEDIENYVKDKATLDDDDNVKDLSDFVKKHLDAVNRLGWNLCLGRSDGENIAEINKFVTPMLEHKWVQLNEASKDEMMESGTDTNMKEDSNESGETGDMQVVAAESIALEARDHNDSTSSDKGAVENVESVDVAEEEEGNDEMTEEDVIENEDDQNQAHRAMETDQNPKEETKIVNGNDEDVSEEEEGEIDEGDGEVKKPDSEDGEVEVKTPDTEDGEVKKPDAEDGEVNEKVDPKKASGEDGEVKVDSKKPNTPSQKRPLVKRVFGSAKKNLTQNKKIFVQKKNTDSAKPKQQSGQRGNSRSRRMGNRGGGGRGAGGNTGKK